HLPPPLAAARPRVLGQPLDHAFRHRLPGRHGAHDVPLDDPRRPPAGDHVGASGARLRGNPHHALARREGNSILGWIITKRNSGSAVSAPPLSVQSAQAAFRLTAETLPCWPRSRSKLIFWPSLRVPRSERSTAEMWTKTSFEPSVGMMKPKPLAGLN